MHTLVRSCIHSLQGSILEFPPPGLEMGRIGKGGILFNLHIYFKAKAWFTVYHQCVTLQPEVVHFSMGLAQVYNFRW